MISMEAPRWLISDCFPLAVARAVGMVHCAVLQNQLVDVLHTATPTKSTSQRHSHVGSVYIVSCVQSVVIRALSDTPALCLRYARRRPGENNTLQTCISAGALSGWAK